MKTSVSCILFLLLLISFSTNAQENELRGVWIAWAGDNIPSKNKIAKMMDEIAAANLNTVYVDVWRNGYPYFKSKVFFQLSGLLTDPAVDDGRDVLSDMIAEGHRVGLRVEAWFEYGFASSWENNGGHILKIKPDWAAKDNQGRLLKKNGFEWMNAFHPEVQEFMLSLIKEVASKYDIDGVQGDDRLPAHPVEGDYSEYTKNLYQSEHNGNLPPMDYNNFDWKIWRANILNKFAEKLFKQIKEINSNLIISYAPNPYPWSYHNYLQDWPSWMKAGNGDLVIPQIYRPSVSIFSSELTAQIGNVNDKSKILPGITAIYENYELPTSEIISMIQFTRSKALIGHSIWYYDKVADDLPGLKTAVYQSQATVPNIKSDWRQPAIIINEDDPQVEKSAGWTNYTGIAGFTGGCIYAKSTEARWIEYHADIPQPGWYEAYCFNIVQWSATKNASFEIYHANGSDTVTVDQTKVGLARWYKLGDFHFDQGADQKIVRLSNSGIGDQLLFADAIMLLNTNRPVELITKVNSKKESKIIPRKFELYQNYPNPFNSDTTIKFSLHESDQVALKIYNILGEEIAVLVDQKLDVGEYTIGFEGMDLVSGIYFYRIQTGSDYKIKKMILVR